MSDGDESSLELLLDTITNAFGGILFLALLVIVLLQMTSDRVADEPPSRETATKLVAMEREVLSATRERDELLRATVIQDQLAKQLVTDENRIALGSLQASRQSSTDLNSQRVKLAAELVNKQNEINTLAQTLSDLKTRVKLKSAEVDDAKLKLQAELRARTTTANLPRLHETSKVEIAVVLRFGRLYFLHRYDPSLASRELNTEDMVILEDAADSVLATPKPYRGTPVDNIEAVRATVLRELKSFPPQAIYLAIAVWEDSFDQFIDLKNLLIELKYEYRVIPLGEGGMISESSIDKPLIQ